MTAKTAAALLVLCILPARPAPAALALQVALDYVLRVDAADLTALHVQMRVRNAPARFTLAAHAHPEYDDKYWRYLEDMRATGGTISRQDSVRWEVSGVRDSVTIDYVVRLPATEVPRAAWRAYLTETGGLIGGPHSFLYVVGAEAAPATVRLVLPPQWQAVSALKQTNSQALHAPDIFTLMESPILVGQLSKWSFDVERVPHRVFYLRGPAAAAFDTVGFVSGIERIVRQTGELFGNIPYDDYTFLIADDAYGGLEHPTSVTLGARSTELAEDPYAITPELAHEFFHTWNLMRIKPVEYRGVDYRVQQPVPSLWFSEGMTLFYADLLMRRAGFTMPQPTRIAHVQQLLGRYANDPAYDRFSAETISRAEYNSPPGALGNHDPSTHLIGEILGLALDLRIRSGTNGRRSLDDLMRAMDKQHHRAGFSNVDIERIASDVCECSMRSLFDAHVRGAGRIDMNEYLAAIGLRAVFSRVPATNDAGEVERDFRIRAWQASPGDTLLLYLWNSESIWVRAGLHTNDRVLRINGEPVTTWPEFRTRIAAVPIGGTVNFDLVRGGLPQTVRVVMSGFERTTVQVVEHTDMTPMQRQLLDGWSAGH